MKVKRATPVLFTDSVEATRDFFVGVGFAVTVEIPDGAALGFAILEHEGVQVMIESRDNSNEPAPIRERSKAAKSAHVFIEVDNLDAVVAALGSAAILVERHTTFYKSDELTCEEPGGNLVTFAQFA